MARKKKMLMMMMMMILMLEKGSQGFNLYSSGDN